MYGDKNMIEATSGCVEVQRPTLTERLQQERDGLAARLNEVDAALAALRANPQVQAVLDLVQKVSRL
jgi:hypothetical protein